ncbi:hypothetical protein CR513_02292, partial [Mucuna pruriens]
MESPTARTGRTSLRSLRELLNLQAKVELKDENTNNTFQVNGHQIKLLHEGPVPPMVEMESENPQKNLKVFHMMFLEKFFPTSRIAAIRKEIYRIRQHSGESLHEYWERFNKLCTTCPYHEIRLLMMDRNMVDAASGGALMDKTPVIVRDLIFNMASNTQQFEIKGGVGTSRVVSEIGKPADGAHISSKAALCRPSSTNHAMSIWDLRLGGAPY